MTSHKYAIDPNSILRKIDENSLANNFLQAPVVLPRSLWDHTLHLHHDIPIAGHRKFKKLLKLMQQQYYFPGMSTYIKGYTDSCLSCQSTTSAKRLRSPLKPYYAGFPGVLVHLDFTKGTGTTVRGNTHILAIIDSFTGYVRLYPTPQPSAKITAECLLQYIAINSMPLKIITDNGKEFANQVITELAYLLGIKHSTIAPYNSKANGKVENIHKIVKTMTRSYIERYKDKWDLLLPLFEFAINTSESEVTHTTPFHLWFGRHPNYPLDSICKDIYKPVMTTDEYVQKLHTERNDLFEWIRLRKQQVANKMKEKYDNKFHNNMKTLKPGQYVLKKSNTHQKGENKKMHPIYGEEIFRIKTDLSNGNYVIENLDSTQTSQQNIGQLKPIKVRYEHYYDAGNDTITSATTTIEIPDETSGSKRNSTSDDDYISYEIKEILDKRHTPTKGLEYKVWWKGYPKAKAQWVPADHVDAPDYIE